MTDAQKAEKAAGDARKELRELALKEDSTAEAIEAKTKELDDLEARSTALAASEPAAEPAKIEPTEDAAARELRSLTGKANVGNIFAAVVNHRAVDRAGEGASRAFRGRLERGPAVAPGGAGRRDGSGRYREHHGPHRSPGFRER